MTPPTGSTISFISTAELRARAWPALDRCGSALPPTPPRRSRPVPPSLGRTCPATPGISRGREGSHRRGPYGLRSLARRPGPGTRGGRQTIGKIHSEALGEVQDMVDICVLRHWPAPDATIGSPAQQDSSQDLLRARLLTGPLLTWATGRGPDEAPACPRHRSGASPRIRDPPPTTRHRGRVG